MEVPLLTKTSHTPGAHTPGTREDTAQFLVSLPIINKPSYYTINVQVLNGGHHISSRSLARLDRTDIVRYCLQRRQHHYHQHRSSLSVMMSPQLSDYCFSQYCM